VRVVKIIFGVLLGAGLGLASALIAKSDAALSGAIVVVALVTIAVEVVDRRRRAQLVIISRPRRP
jgi:hypothetical protein